MAQKALFVAASDSFASCPVRARSLEVGLSSRHASSDKRQSKAPPLELCKCLLARFSSFQVKAKAIQEQVEATQVPVDTALAEEMLFDYAKGVSHEFRSARDQLRRSGRWDMNPAARADHDTLCFCLAVLDLVQVIGLVSTAPAAPRLLQWYSSHYLEEDLVEWWQQALDAAQEDVLEKDSSFWEPLCRLALADCRLEVLDLLQRCSASRDDQVAIVCNFIRRMPSQRQMDEGGASAVEFCQCAREIQHEAQRLLKEAPKDHPVKQLLRVYAGSSQASFEANEDIAAKMSRTWVEDFIFSQAWVFPDLRRAELGDLLRAVARRRPSESIDDVDRVLFAALMLDVPELLRLLSSMPDRFPGFFVVHLVDMLYFAGRVPFETSTSRPVPPRDWHLMAYAEELCRGPRELWRYALDYLRAAGSPAAVRFLKTVADRYCTSAAHDDAALMEALAVLADLGLSSSLGQQQCWRRVQQLRASGDHLGCVRWACWAEVGIASASGAGKRQEALESLDKAKSGSAGASKISELLDTLAEEDLPGLLAALSPPDLEESLDHFPSNGLLLHLTPPMGAGSLPSLPASGRLCFFTQYARCHALRKAAKPASLWAPVLVNMLVQGMASPSVAKLVLQEELMPVLEEDLPPLDTENVLLLMRLVQTSGSLDKEFSLDGEVELTRLLGACLSRSILRGPVRLGAVEPETWGRPLTA